MDPRGRETDALGAAGSLARLTEATGAEFPALLEARRRTEERLLERREALATLPIDPDAAIVLMGSWGRLEVTAGSDGREWGLRNAKLRTSRPLLFASGLLPILECHRLPATAIGPFLAEQFEATPTDRISSCFLNQGRPDSGARAMAAYDAFISMLNDESARYELETLLMKIAIHRRPSRKQSGWAQKSTAHCSPFSSRPSPYSPSPGIRHLLRTAPLSRVAPLRAAAAHYARTRAPCGHR